MNFPILKSPTVKFIFFIFIFYISFYLIYIFAINPYQKVDLFVVDITIKVSKWMLELMNYAVFTNGPDRLIGIDGTGGLYIGDSCNGILLFILFAGFIVSFSGKWIPKTIYVLSGIILIQILNILRVVVLAIIDTHSRSWTEFNHTYTFTLIIYAFIFCMWILWVNKFSHFKKNE